MYVIFVIIKKRLFYGPFGTEQYNAAFTDSDTGARSIVRTCSRTVSLFPCQDIVTGTMQSHVCACGTDLCNGDNNPLPSTIVTTPVSIRKTLPVNSIRTSKTSIIASLRSPTRDNAVVNNDFYCLAERRRLRKTLKMTVALVCCCFSYTVITYFEFLS